MIMTDDTQSDPDAMRYSFDGFGYKYIDSGSGSDWRTRHPDAEPLYLSQPTQSDALVSALVEASEGLKQDLLNRAEWDEDVKVVCAGAGAWFRFVTALAALQEQSK
jgi:hypothetical protein